MKSEYLKGKKCMVWTFMGNSRMYQALEKYGDRLDTVGIFSFSVNASGVISETGIDVSKFLPYIQKWRHIKWLLTINNDGYAPIFTALRNNTNGAKSTFLSEIVRIMRKYPWCAGIDIDLERGGEFENREKANQLFKEIYQTVKSYNSSKIMNICLPGMTGINGSVGGENWCVYADLNAFCDTVSIMTYGMSWAGSAPGPISPRDWLEGTYDYAVTAFSPDKIFLGMPAYGWNWQISHTPEELNQTYRGESYTYYAAKNMAAGMYNFTGDRPPQPFIPMLMLWDDYNKVPWGMPQVYDYCEGQDCVNKSAPLVSEVYQRRRYLTCYGKEQSCSFGTIYAEHNGEPDEVIEQETIILTEVTMDNNGETTETITEIPQPPISNYYFNVPSNGNFDIAIKVVFPFWNKNSITLKIDDTEITVTEERLWWPYWRKTCWLSLAESISLFKGKHTISFEGKLIVQFLGFCVCGNFEESPTAGEAEYSFSPRSFIDVDGRKAVPDKGFKLTAEVLRRKPESALIWYEDFRDEDCLKPQYYEKQSGEWGVWRDTGNSESVRPYAQLEGSGALALAYSGFTDVHLRCKIAFPQNSNGKAGIFVGDIFLCINIDNKKLELYQSDKLLGSWQGDFLKTANSDIRTKPNMYQIEFRIRNNKVRVYSGTSSVLRFTANVSETIGNAGIKSDSKIICELLRLGDAWYYEPYEKFDIVMPDGTTKSFGRIERSGVTWNDKYSVFKVNSDVEEIDTRAEDITLNYDFFHSDLLNIKCGGDYTAKFIPHDINIWISRLFLGDADGFSILYYQDVDSLIYWSNQAAYRWGLRGMCIWSLGQEDLSLWEALPRQI